MSKKIKKIFNKQVKKGQKVREGKREMMCEEGRETA